MFRLPALVALCCLFFTSCGLQSDCEHINYTPCENGFSESYPCNNVHLYAVVTPDELLGEKLNDIWGWTDPETGSEYALVGLTDGVSIVDITTPSEPIVIGKLNEPEHLQKNKNLILPHHEDGGFKGASAWRDLKVYRNHLFVVSEQVGHGMQVFDLTQLRDINREEAPIFFEEDINYGLFGNAHNIEINELTGYAYAVGVTTGEVCAEKGGLHIINIQSPLEPIFAGCYYDAEAGGITRQGYIHDTQCVIYSGPDAAYQGREICFNSAESVFLITDVEEKLNASTISIESFEGSSYIHQGWLTEDHRYFFMNDEGDERQFNHQTRTYVWNVENLENPEMIGYYEHPTQAVDHNLYINNGIMYQANYTAGLRVLDVSNPLPDQVTEIGYFNTTPNNDEPVFSGLWSVYPWFSDQKIVVSDINNGLFILNFEP